MSLFSGSTLVREVPHSTRDRALLVLCVPGPPNCKDNGPHTAYTLYLRILGHYVGHFRGPSSSELQSPSFDFPGLTKASRRNPRRAGKGWSLPYVNRNPIRLKHTVLCAYPKGPSTQYLRTLVPETMKSMVFGTRILNIGYLDPLGTVSPTQIYGRRAIPSVKAGPFCRPVDASLCERARSPSDAWVSQKFQNAFYQGESVPGPQKYVTYSWRPKALAISPKGYYLTSFCGPGE